MDNFEIILRAHAARVKGTMTSPFRYETEEFFMRKKSHRKTMLLVAVAAAFLLSISALAAGFIPGWFSASTGEATAPELESFENGYAYASGQSMDNSVTEDDGSVKEQFKSAFFVYEKDGDEVWFSQDASESVNVEKGRLAATVDGIDIYYYSYENKAVPEDYQKTPEDIAAEERGELILSWGSDSVRQYTVQSVEWRRGNIACCLMQMDGALSEAELIAMAKECLAAG